jgi:hypothetical protein
MSWKEKLRKLIGPLLVSVAFGMIFYFGGETSQTVGLEAFRQTRQVLDFLAGMGTILALAVLVNRFLRYVVLEGVVAPALGSAVPQLLVQLTPPLSSSWHSPRLPASCSRRISRCCWRRPVSSGWYSASRCAN